MNKNKDELVSPRHPFIHATHSFKGGPVESAALFLLVIPISHCSFLTFYGVKSDDDWPPFTASGRGGGLLLLDLEI